MLAPRLIQSPPSSTKFSVRLCCLGSTLNWKIFVSQQSPEFFRSRPRHFVPSGRFSCPVKNLNEAALQYLLIFQKLSTAYSSALYKKAWSVNSFTLSLPNLTIYYTFTGWMTALIKRCSHRWRCIFQKKNSP